MGPWFLRYLPNKERILKIGFLYYFMRIFEVIVTGRYRSPPRDGRKHGAACRIFTWHWRRYRYSDHGPARLSD